MTTEVRAGEANTLTVEWRQYPGGPMAAVTGVTIAVASLPAGTVVLAATSTGVTTPSTGINAYSWTPSALLAEGEYLVTWSGTDADTDTVTATEIVTLSRTAVFGESYATLAQLKRRLGIPDSKTTGDIDLQDKLDSATEDINRWCGRSFWRYAEASEREYLIGRTGVDTDDFWTATDLAVVPYLGTTAGTAWTISGVTLEPLNGIVDGQEGWPYRRISYGWSMASFYSGYAYARVTAKWGWAEVPAPVVTACMLIAAMDNKAGDAPFGVAGFGDYAVRIRANPMAEEKLRPFVKNPAKVAS